MPTPERWTVGEDHGHLIEILDVQDLPIATVIRYRHDPPEWATENARIMSAAKQLLEAAKSGYAALRDIINAANNDEGYTPQELADLFMSDCNTLFKAIAKTEGTP